MNLIRSLDQVSDELRSGAVTIGNFDGVHRGHARIIERLIAKAREVDGPAVVFTFDPHPVRILRPDLAPAPLTWTDRKAALLSELGADSIIAYPTDEPLLSLSPGEFFQQIVRERLEARAMVEGPNFCFGRNREGNVEVLRQLCEETGIALEIVPPLKLGEDYVSSSRVRDAIRQGDVGSARELLTRPYRVRGMVTHGSQRGAKIGFPTANIDAIDTLLLAPGVYAGRASALGQTYVAAINVGSNPTFGEDALKVEAHLLDFDKSLYGEPLEVDFLARLRDIHPFDSVEQLQDQLRRDVEMAREIAEKA